MPNTQRSMKELRKNYIRYVIKDKYRSGPYIDEYFKSKKAAYEWIRRAIYLKANQQLLHVVKVKINYA